MKKAIIIVTFILSLGNTAYSQSRIDSIRLPASKQLFELLPVITPWIGSSNPSAISFLNIKGFSFVETGYLVDNKDIKYTHQPGKTGSFFIGTSGYKTIGKVSFYGSFKYSNDIYNDILYNSTLVFDTWNPYLVADTIGGKQTKEEFSLLASIGYKISEKLTIAGNINYLSAAGAKLKDPRNLNTVSRFCIAPGLTYKMDKFTLGLSGSFFRNTNDVKVDCFGNQKYSIFKFAGLGYYTETVYVSDYETRYPAKGFSFGAQLDFRNGNLENITDFSVKRETIESRYGTSFRFIDGASNTEVYSLKNHLRYFGESGIHNLELEGSISYLYGNDSYSYKNVKRYLDGVPYDSIYLYTYRANAIIITQKSVAVRYNFLTLGPSGLKDFEAGGSVRIDYYYSGRYPVLSEGTFNTLNLITTLNIRKTLYIDKLFISPSFEAYFRTNLNSDLQFMPPSGILVLPEMIVDNYNAMIASVYGGTFSAEIEMPRTKGFIRTFYFKPEGSYYFSPDLVESTGRNFFVRAALGFTF